MSTRGERRRAVRTRGADVAPTAELDNAAAGIGPLTRQPASAGPGRYRLAVAVITFPGAWTITVRARSTTSTR